MLYTLYEQHGLSLLRVSISSLFDDLQLNRRKTVLLWRTNISRSTFAGVKASKSCQSPG